MQRPASGNRLGSRQFLALYFIGGLVANLVHMARNVASDTPVIGASGAVSAVLGAYLYFFPQRHLDMTFSFIPFRIHQHISALDAAFGK